MSTYKERFMNRRPVLSEQDKLFLDWVDNVETVVRDKIGLGLMDIGDMPYYTSFEKGVSVAEMAKQTVSNFYGLS